ncbi:hypothetical protein AHAS_Ahas14G0158900 [Arachis hypogaea]
MVEQFGIGDKKWIHDMYKRRHSWTTTYIRGKFFAGFRTTLRCEGLHIVISRKVCKVACHSTKRFQFVRDMVMLMLKHFENKDAVDTTFPPEGPSNEGGTSRNPRKHKTKGNSANDGKKSQRCPLC